MQKMLKKLLLSPECQLLLTFKAGLGKATNLVRPCWSGLFNLISQLNYLSQFFSCHLNNHYAVFPPKSLEQDINIYYFIW